MLGSGPFSRDGQVIGNKHLIFRPYGISGWVLFTNDVNQERVGGQQKLSRENKQVNYGGGGSKLPIKMMSFVNAP